MSRRLAIKSVNSVREEQKALKSVRAKSSMLASRWGGVIVLFLCSFILFYFIFLISAVRVLVGRSY